MASLSVKMYKTRQCRTIFCTSHVQSVSDAVSQSVSQYKGFYFQYRGEGSQILVRFGGGCWAGCRPRCRLIRGEGGFADGEGCRGGVVQALSDVCSVWARVRRFVIRLAGWGLSGRVSHLRCRPMCV